MQSHGSHSIKRLKLATEQLQLSPSQLLQCNNRHLATNKLCQDLFDECISYCPFHILLQGLVRFGVYLWPPVRLFCNTCVREQASSDRGFHLNVIQWKVQHKRCKQALYGWLQRYPHTARTQRCTAGAAARQVFCAMSFQNCGAQRIDHQRNT